MTVYSVRDVAAKRMPQHSFAVVLIYSIFLAQSRKGMTAVVWGMLFPGRSVEKAERLQLGVHFITKTIDANAEKISVTGISGGYHVMYARVNGDGSFYAGLGFYSALEIPILQVGFHVGKCSDSKTGIAHYEKHFHNRIIFVRPKHF